MLKKFLKNIIWKLIKYENNKNVFVICSCGNREHKATLSDIKKGKKCMECRSKRMMSTDVIPYNNKRY